MARKRVPTNKWFDFEKKKSIYRRFLVGFLLINSKNTH